MNRAPTEDSKLNPSDHCGIWKLRILAVILSFVLTSILQSWVGGVSLYKKNNTRKLQLHEAILTNAPPKGDTWSTMGAKGTNVRIATVYVAEQIHQLTGIKVLSVYRWIDSVCLFAIFLLLFLYLGAWFETEFQLIGVLYFGIIAILSYLFFYFHPWDRPSQVVWLLLLIASYKRQYPLVCFLLVVGTIIKWDTITFPLFYLLLEWDRRFWRSVIVRTAVLIALACGTHYLIFNSFPGGSNSADSDLLNRISAQIAKNWGHFMQYGFAFPPLLAWLLPWLLAWPQLFSKDRFLRAAAIYGYLLFLPYILTVNFREVRTELYLCFFLLPPALETLRAHLQSRAAIASSRTD